MVQNGKNRHDKQGSELPPHDEFLELCAVSTTGELSEYEQKTLKEHLSTCAECRQALGEFETVANIGAPLLSSELATPIFRDRSTVALQTERAEGVMPDLTVRSADSGSEDCRTGERDVSIFAGLNGNHSSSVNWNYLWLPFAAAVLLTIALGIYSYQVGRRHAPQTTRTKDVSAEGKLDALEQRLSDAGHEREVLRTQLADRDRTIRALERRINNESVALNEAKNAQANMEHSLQDALDEKQQMEQQQTSAGRNLDAAQASIGKMEAELDSLRRQRDRDELTTGSLETQIKDLNAELRQSQQTVGKQEDLLADDRDIRELMGARDLYIAEVYDVARNGATQKSYGRVFYTKGKSLVFYAYDLDQQPGVKDASTFQAWGQSGPDRGEALSLGIFYQDGVAKKRWVLRFSDPRALEQINAVFVTVEPRGGSHKPSGKPLLFASLRIEPNHP